MFFFLSILILLDTFTEIIFFLTKQSLLFFFLPIKTIYQIKPMENSPQCMIYIPWKTESMNEDTILFGDDQGTVGFKLFLQKTV